jgi:hypothetical protein
MRPLLALGDGGHWARIAGVSTVTIDPLADLATTQMAPPT